MNRLITALFMIFICFTSYSQEDSIDVEFDMDMSVEDYEYIKALIKSDVVNWCENKNEKRDIIVWKMLGILDTIIPITIETDSGSFEINIVEEATRRVIGGFAGSYTFVEFWNISTGGEKLIEIVKAIKYENPDLKVPNNESNIEYIEDSDRYFVEFYDPKRNEIIFTYVRGSTLGLIGYAQFQEDKDEHNYVLERKLINKDFWKIENEERIREFELMVVKRIEDKIAK